MKKILLPLLLLTGAALTAGAQEKPTLLHWAETTLLRMTSPKRSLDSAYVLQPRLKWMVAADGNTIHTGVDLHSDITVSDFRTDVASITKGTMDIGMANSLYKKAGLSVGYGGLSLGYGIELGKHSPERNTYFSFGGTGSFYGYQIQYYKTHQYVSGSLSMEGTDPVALSSAHPGEMRNISLNGFYAFNRHKFVFGSAYTGRLLQRRSAGSWLVTAKYMQGDFSVDPEDVAFTGRLNGLHRYSTQQFSLGGGYSFNWVLFHREPHDDDNWKGLSNLTLNATLLPMISFLNNIRTEQGDGNDAQRIRYSGQPTLTPAARGALCYAWNRYFVTLQATYGRFSFHGADTDVEQENGHLRIRIRTQGVFYDLSAKLQLGVRF